MTERTSAEMVLHELVRDDPSLGASLLSFLVALAATAGRLPLSARLLAIKGLADKALAG